MKSFLLTILLSSILKDLASSQATDGTEEDLPEQEIPWKQTGKLWTEAKYNGGIEYKHDEHYSEHSLKEGGIYMIEWCHSDEHAAAIDYGLKDICEGQVTEENIHIGNTQHEHDEGICGKIELPMEKECIIKGGFFRKEENGEDKGI